MKVLGPLRTDSTSLTNRVHKDLRMDILTGEIPGGTRLVESSLAKQMGVSRTPVREALHKLALEGLLYSIPRAGYMVEEMSEDDIQDLFQTRMAIEQLAARWALDHITAKEIESLERNLERTDEVLRGDETEEMIDLDKEFHHVLYRASRSKKLYQICKTLSDHTLKFRIACIHIPEIAQRAREGHYGIYQAIRSGEAEKVDASIERHILVTKDDILNFLRKMRQESFLNQDFEL